MLDEIRARRDEIYAIARKHKAEKLWVFEAKVELKTSRIGTLTRYDTLVPHCAETGLTEKSLDAGCRFNLMLNDNDGDGRDATIEIEPDTFHSKEILLATIVRFAASR